MKRILIDARMYGLEHSGIGRYTVNLLKEIAKIDKENTYILLLKDNYYKSLSLPSKWEKIRVDHQYYSLKEQLKLSNVIEQANPDLVHFPHFNVPIRYKGKYVVTIHDMTMHHINGKNATTLPMHKYLIKRVGYKFVFGNAVKKSQKIIVPSKTVKKELIKSFHLDQHKLVVTYEGLDQSTVSTYSEKAVLRKYALTKPYFLYVGNAYPHKNLGRAIEAIVQLNKLNKTDITFAIVTPKNEFQQKLHQKITALDAQQYVKLIGFVTDEELSALMRASYAFIYPSLMEGFGIQGLEAIANDTLLLASDIPIFKEIYGDSAIYFNPFDFSSIEKALEFSLAMKAKTKEKKLKENKKTLMKYSWSKMAQETLEVYNSVLNEK